jgi:integrase
MARRKRASGEGTVYPRPDGRWSGQVTVGFTEEGRQVRRTVYGRTQRECLEKLEAEKEKLRSGRIDREGRTVAEAADGWYEALAGSLAPKSLATYANDLRPIKEGLGPVRLDSLTAQHVARWHAAMAGDGLPGGKRRQAAARLRQVLRWWMRQGVLHRNAAAAVPLPRHAAREITPLTGAEVRGLAALAAGGLWRLAALVPLAVDSGARVGELLALRREDWSRPRLDIVRQIPPAGEEESAPLKTRASRRRVVLSGPTGDLLDAHLARLEAELPGVPWLFPRPSGRPYSPSRLATRWWRPLVKRWGRPGVRFHDLRHTCATLLLAGGVDVKTVSVRLGHSSPVITLRTYAHVLPEMAERAAAVLGGAIWGP